MIPTIFKCNSIKEARYKAVKLIMNEGIYGTDERKEKVKFVNNLGIYIHSSDCELSSDPITARLQKDFALGLIDNATAKERGSAFEYAYGNELREDDALDRTIEHLRENPETRRAVIPMFKIKHVGKNEVPCMCIVYFYIVNGELHVTVSGRSNDDVIAMQSDLYGFSELLKWVADQLGLEYGFVFLEIVNAHCRVNSDMDEIKKVLAEGF